jgi:ribonuclease III
VIHLTDKFSVRNLQQIIGYKFNSPKILLQARTRRQYYQGKKSKEEKNTMEPLATLGDAVLDLIVINNLYQKNERDEGRLSQEKENDVKKTRAFTLAKNLHYEKFVRWGKGEKKDKIWNSGPDTFDTCIEALIGAVFLDAQKKNLNGIIEAENMLNHLSF